MQLSLANTVNLELDIRKSRFISQVKPIASLEEGLAVVEGLQKEHPQATHVCYVILADGQVRQSDDGEPSGTAAAPMLNVLQHKNLTQVVATVVRYFGGVKLGAGGLVRAYSQSISEALNTAEYTSLKPLSSCKISLDYAQENNLRHLATKFNLELNLVYEAQLIAEASGELAALQELLSQLNDLTKGELLVIQPPKEG